MNNDIYLKYTPNDELYHFGILGQKWGIRRYQNEDGTLTEEGKIRYYGKRLNKYSDYQTRTVYEIRKKEKKNNDTAAAFQQYDELSETTAKLINDAVLDGMHIDIDTVTQDDKYNGGKVEKLKYAVRTRKDGEEAITIKKSSQSAYDLIDAICNNPIDYDIEYDDKIAHKFIGIKNNMNNDIYLKYTPNDELYHFGILGQKWGIRRYQNEDGTLTEEGRRHYGKTLKKLEKNYYDAKSQEQFNYSKYDRTGNEKYYKKAENATKVAQMLESNTWKAIGSAIQDGYNVDIEQGRKLNKVVVDRTFVGAFALGAPAGVATGFYNLAMYPETRNLISTNKYKVRKSTNQQGNLTQHTRNKPYI